MAKTKPREKHSKQAMPILARHAVSLAVTFALGLILSVFVAQRLHQSINLGKLNHTDETTFNQGLGYVVSRAGTSEKVTEKSLATIEALPDTQRAADLLLAVAQSHANRQGRVEPAIPDAVTEAIAPLMQRLDPMPAIGLYDALVQIRGVNALATAQSLLDGMEPKDSGELLAVVDLLDARLLWSQDRVPTDLWVRWLGALAQSESELTQAQTATRLGSLPGLVDDPRIIAGLTTLAKSEHATVRNTVLHAVAGYAAIANDPTDYEQLVFDLGQDDNQHVARRAWMIAGHLNPFSGFAVNWQDADPFVAEAMLWAAVKTNPENPKAALDAYRNLDTRYISYIPLSAAEAKEQTKQLGNSVLDPVNLANPSLAWRHFCAATNATLPSKAARDGLIANVLRRATTGRPDGEGDTDWNWDRHLGPLLACVHFAYDPVYSGPEQQELRRAHALALAERSAGLKQTEPILPISAEQHSPAELRLIAGAAGTPQTFELHEIKSLLSQDVARMPLATVALMHQDATIADAPNWNERPFSVNESELIVLSAFLAAIAESKPQVVSGLTLQFRKTHPDLTGQAIHALSDQALAEMGLSRIDALPALLEAAEAAPPSANRQAEAKLLRLALWMRGDLGDAFTPTAEAMLFDDDLPTSTVLMALLHKRRPAALDYLFGGLATPRPDLYKLFVQERYWHVFRRFVDTSDLPLWLWGDPEAQAFQLEAMRQWYAVNRWKIANGWWPASAPGNDRHDSE